MAELENIIESVMSSPESIGRIMDVVKLLGGQTEENKPNEKKEENPLSQMGNTLGFEPEIISKVISLAGNYNVGDDRRIRLLEAIRPYVKSEEEYHIDKAIRIIKLSRVAKGVFEEFLR